MRRSRLGVAALLAVLVVALPASARPAPGTTGAAEPGITATQVVLGGTGPAGSSVARGLAAYLRWVDARGGVHGRRLAFRFREASGPEQALEATRRLVEEDGVFALVGSSGTEENLAVRGYLNGARVPQLFVASGATALGRDYRRSPWTVGFGASNALEGRVHGAFVARTQSAAKVAVLLEGRDGAELLAGLEAGLRGSRVRVVATERHDPGAPRLRAQLARLLTSRADVLAILASRVVAAEALTAVRGGPLVLLSTEAAAAAAPEGALSIAWWKSPDDPRWADDPGLALYRSILRGFAPGADPHDAGHLRGMAIAHAAVRILRAVGPEPTRAAVLARARALRDASSPFLLPGISLATSRADGAPIEQVRLQRRSGGVWRTFGGLWASEPPGRT